VKTHGCPSAWPWPRLMLGAGVALGAGGARDELARGHTRDEPMRGSARGYVSGEPARGCARG
jgi:hypothetical protein